MSKIPKCEGCKYHSYITSEGYAFDGWGQRYHWCCLHSMEGNTAILGRSKFIKASEAKTSPKWCILRTVQNLK